jgi:cytochrome c peroxidase
VALAACACGVVAAAESNEGDTVASRAELGRLLFFDRLLSRDHSVSCASCHKPEHAFADTVRISPGVGGALGTRNAPSAMNTAGRLQLFWDGRAATLEEQALSPIENPLEMALSIDAALARVNGSPRYAAAFQQWFGGPATRKTLGKALAAFEKTLETSNSPYDRYAKGDETAISDEARRGRLIFIGKANCANCHSGEDFTSDRFKNIGLFNGKDLNDSGRAAISGHPEDAGAFKVPSLRNVAVTAPYMHNGMFATLREVIEYYNDPDRTVKGGLHRDAVLNKPLGLTETELSELEAFLRTLTDDRFAHAS